MSRRIEMISLIIAPILIFSCMSDRPDEIGDRSRVTQLIEDLKDDDINVRARAIDALGKTGNPDLIQVIAEQLTSTDIRIRLQSVHALSRIGDPGVVPHIESALEDERGIVRKTALTSLGRLQDEQDTIVLLTKAVMDDPDNSICIHAARSLAKRIGPESAEILRERLKKSFDTEEISLSITLIEIIEEVDPGSWKAIILKSASDPAPLKRIRAAEILYKRGDSSRLSVIRRALSESDPEIKIRAITALGSMGDKESLKAISLYTESENRDLRNRARWAVTEIEKAG
ncbi:HEAT repeat domain-containing protein [Thermodesulfobacteriota bacterium]